MKSLIHYLNKFLFWIWMPDNGENNQQKPNFVSWPQKHLFWQEMRKLGTKYIIWANNFLNSDHIGIFTSNSFSFPK